MTETVLDGDGNGRQEDINLKHINFNATNLVFFTKKSKKSS
jgi:hypothetical protein